MWGFFSLIQEQPHQFNGSTLPKGQWWSSLPQYDSTCWFSAYVEYCLLRLFLDILLQLHLPARLIKSYPNSDNLSASSRVPSLHDEPKESKERLRGRLGLTRVLRLFCSPAWWACSNFCAVTRLETLAIKQATFFDLPFIVKPSKELSAHPVCIWSHSPIWPNILRLVSVDQVTQLRKKHFLNKKTVTNLNSDDCQGKYSL